MEPNEAMLPVERLRELFSYDPVTGDLRWKIAPNFKPELVGEIAGSKDSRGYRRVTINLKRVLAHRIAWAIENGSWPRNEIDHIDANPANNAIYNLREATSSQNKRNVRLSKRNTTGFKGVTRNTGCRLPFKATIYVNGKNRVIGSFRTAEEAHVAYCNAAKQHYGEFARAA